MKLHRIKYFIGWILALINTLCGLGLLFCTYSTFLHPKTFPNWSYFGLFFPVFLIPTLCFAVFWLFFRKRLCLISIAAMILCSGSIRTYCPINPFQGTPEGRTIKVMSYNVHSFCKTEGEQSWDENAIVNYLINSDADIVCLQEAGGLGNAARTEIYGLLEQNYPHISTSDSHGCAVLSRFPIISQEKLDYPSESNSSYIFTILCDQDTITVINNHMESYKLNDDDKEKYKEILRNIDYHDESIHMEEDMVLLESKVAKATSIRGIQADSIQAFIERCPTRHIIACGDFNDSPISYVHRTLTKTLNDAYTRAGNGPGLSYHRSGMYFRIDNILISETFDAYNAKVDDSVKESDHYPIFCTLEIH